MDFNFDTGLISGGLQTLDVTTIPPLGGVAGVLTIVGDGAVTLPKGDVSERPVAPESGMFRYNTDTDQLEYYNGTTWAALSVGGGTVTSVGATSDTAALTITGSPITSSGSFTFNLDADLTAIAALSGTGFAVRTAADTWAVRDIVGTSGNIVVTNGSGVAGNATVDLAAITQADSGNFVKITLDGFGRVTGNTAVVESDITTLVDDVYVNVSGDTMDSGANLTFIGGGEVLGLPATPSGATAATSKAYVDSVAEGLKIKPAVEVVVVDSADIAAMGDFTYDNGTGGVGATITADDPGAWPTIDGYLVNSATPGQNGVLIAFPPADPNAYMNGRYNLIQVGDVGEPWILERCALCDTANEIAGAYTFVKFGDDYAGTGWVQTYIEPFTLGTDPIIVTQFSGAGTYSAGSGLTLTGNVFSLTSPVAVSLGGTGTTTAATNGQLLIGNGSGYTLSTLTAGTAIGITNGAGSITIDNTGVTSLSGTANEIEVSASTGAVTIGLPDDVVIADSLTVSGLTANGALYATTGGLIASTAALTNGQLLVGSTGGSPVAATLTGGTGVTVTNGAGTITIDIDDSEVVTSFSGGTTGLTPSSATSGNIVLGGTLATTNGGTGLTSTGTSNQILGVNNDADGLEYKTITAGTGISVTHGANVVTISNTGVTNVALSAPSIFSVSGSPVTTTGTLTFALETQSANTVFAGPASGADAVPTFRALVFDDLAGVIELYRENPVTPDEPVASGDNAVAIGSGSQASGDNAIAFGEGSDARIVGQKAFANGSFATAGDAQHGVYVARGITTDNTLTELFLNGLDQQLVMPDNSVFTFDILVAARRTDAVGGGAGYRFVGVARKDATAGSVTFVGTPSKTVIGETDNPWDAAVSVDTTTGAFRVRVTGQNAKTIRWVATILTTEVTN